MDAWLGSPSTGTAWPGRTIFASPLDSNTANSLKSTFPPDVSVDPGQTWLTTLDDTSSPRPGAADLFFQPSKTQVATIPPPIDISQFHAFMFPLDPLILFGWIGFRRLRSRSYPNGAPALSLFTGAALGSALCAIAFDLMGVAGVNAMKANVEWPQQVLLGSLIGGMVLGALIAFRRFGGRPVS
jgi:hypothetical protein